MVDEFSSFARMPAPVMQRDEDLAEIVRQAAFLQRTATPRSESKPNAAEADRLRLRFAADRQALVNMLKNAAESIHARAGADAAPGIRAGQGRSS